MHGGIDAGTAAPDAAPPPVPDARTMDAIDRLMIRETANVGAFTRIDRAPYASTVGSFDIDVYPAASEMNVYIVIEDRDS